MKETPSNDSNIFESWLALADTTMAGYPVAPVAQAFTKAQQSRKEDPWVTLIDRLWDVNLVSTLRPLILGKLCMSSTNVA